MLLSWFITRTGKYFFDPLKDVVTIPSLAHGMLGGMEVTQHRHFRNVEKCDGIKHFCKLHKKTKDVHPIYVLHGTQKESEHNCVKRCVKFIVDFRNSNMDIQTAKGSAKCKYRINVCEYLPHNEICHTFHSIMGSNKEIMLFPLTTRVAVCTGCNRWPFV